MKKQDLIALGIPEEQAQKVVTMHDDEIKNSFVPLHRFSEVNAELSTAKTTITTLQATNGDVTTLTNEVNRLKGELENTKANHTKELSNFKKNTAIESALTGGEYIPHDLGMVLGMIDTEKINVKDDNTLDGLKDQLDALVKEKAFLFKSAGSEGNKSNPINGWLPFGSEPKDGEGAREKGGDDFGKSLAQSRKGGSSSYDYFKQ